MKLKFAIIMSIAATLAACTGCDTERIGKSTLTLNNDRMTPEALWALGRLGDVQISPDSTKMMWGVQYCSVEKNASNRELFVANIDGSEMRQITQSAKSEYAAKWLNGGKKIAFLHADDNGEIQLWQMNADGTNRTQISHKQGGISDFLISPDETKILFVANVKFNEIIAEKPADLPLATGRKINDLMYRHWDEWVEQIPHAFLADFDGKTLSNERDLLEGEPFECPMKPFGGVEQLAFSPDSKTIAYTCRKKIGKAYAESTNSDIYLYDIEQGKTIKNLTEGMMGYDINPTFSPDGTKIAFESMKHDGWESDKNRLFVIDLQTGERTDISENWDQSCGTLVWDKTSENIYLTSVQHGTTQIYRANLATKTFAQITAGQHDYEAIALANDRIIGVRHSMSAPNDIYAIDEKTGEQTQLTFENQELLSQMTFGRVEERWMETSDKKQMQVWVIYPPHFDATKKYPTLLYCQGGPQSPVSQFWSFRWNFQIMAANDYIVVAPNRRGLYGYGNEWLEQISGDYGGQCMRDYLTAIDTYSREPWVDTEHLGCIGASFGGYSVYWLAGHHEKRFKAFVSHCGMFNFDQQYLTTEEMWFVNRDLGGAYWDKNAAIQHSFTNSPHLFVDKWDTPILCIHGEKDFRIPYTQGMGAFNAAILRGVPAELLIFPDENHWVTKPQNGILWQRTFFEWLDKWLKE